MFNERIFTLNAFRFLGAESTNSTPRAFYWNMYMSIDLVEQIKTKAALSESKRVLAVSYSEHSDGKQRSLTSADNYSEAYLELVNVSEQCSCESNKDKAGLLQVYKDEKLCEDCIYSDLTAHTQRIKAHLMGLNYNEKKNNDDNLVKESSPDNPFSDKLFNFDTIRDIERGKRRSSVKSLNKPLKYSRWEYLIFYIGDSPYSVYKQGPFEASNQPVKGLWYFAFGNDVLVDAKFLIGSKGSMFPFSAYVKNELYQEIPRASEIIFQMGTLLTTDLGFRRMLHDEHDFLFFHYCILLFRLFNSESKINAGSMSSTSASNAILKLLDFIFSGDVKTVLDKYDIYQATLDYVVNLLFHGNIREAVISELRMSQLR